MRNLDPSGLLRYPTQPLAWGGIITSRTNTFENKQSYIYTSWELGNNNDTRPESTTEFPNP
jgi:hypothetical protein